ncbi:hypothetical protein AOLI_G00021080 [Acnodon oligacanthus]
MAILRPVLRLLSTSSSSSKGLVRSRLIKVTHGLPLLTLHQSETGASPHAVRLTVEGPLRLTSHFLSVIIRRSTAATVSVSESVKEGTDSQAKRLGCNCQALEMIDSSCGGLRVESLR